MIAQNESEVGNDNVTGFLLVSDYFSTLDIGLKSIKFETRHLWIPYNIRVLSIYLRQVPGFNTDIYIPYLNEITLLKSVACHCWLQTYSAWSNQVKFQVIFINLSFNFNDTFKGLYAQKNFRLGLRPCLSDSFSYTTL